MLFALMLTLVGCTRMLEETIMENATIEVAPKEEVVEVVQKEERSKKKNNWGLAPAPFRTSFTKAHRRLLINHR